MLATTLACLALLSAALLVWQWAAAAQFPLNARHSTPGQPLAISVLKPVTGADAGTAEALASWLNQSYPGPVEILFGVSSASDPAVNVVQELLARYPNANARLVFCTEQPVLNRKVGKLIQMSRVATGDLIVVSDADVWVPTDLLSQASVLLAEPKVGLVHCLYRLADAPTAATRWEAFVVNADFWSQVLQNQTLGPLNYALGAVMMLRRSDLDAVGGFTAMGNYLADDNRLGRLITSLGRQTRLCPIVVDCRVSPADWIDVWNHQLRWAITIRVCQPLPYFLSILANGTLWPLLWAANSHSRASITAAAALLLFRIIQGLSLESRFTGRPRQWSSWWIAPLKDLLQVALWGTSFLRRHVLWRGARYRVQPDGRLMAEIPASSPVPDSHAAEPLARSGFGIPPGTR